MIWRIEGGGSDEWTTGNGEDRKGKSEKGRATDQAVAFLVCQIGGETGGQGLLEDGDVSCSCGVVHAGCERDGFGGKRGLDAVWGCIIRHCDRIATMIMVRYDGEHSLLG